MSYSQRENFKKLQLARLETQEYSSATHSSSFPAVSSHSPALHQQVIFSQVCVLSSSSLPISAMAQVLSMDCHSDQWKVSALPVAEYSLYRTCPEIKHKLCRDPGSPRPVCINDKVRKPVELPSSNVTLKSVSISFLTSSKSSSNHSLT